MLKKSMVPVTWSSSISGEADAAPHPDPLGGGRPDAVAEPAEVGDEDEVPRSPGAPGETHALTEGRGEGDLAELVAGATRFLHERQGPAGRVHPPVQPVGPAEALPDEVQGVRMASSDVVRAGERLDDVRHGCDVRPRFGGVVVGG